MDAKSFNIRVPKRWVRVAMIVGATALIVAPLTAIAMHNFDDVPNSNTFHADIAAIADAGVTLGCNPPDNDEYCPDDFVTREQMAAFMNRLGALGPGKTPVANAATVDGIDSSEIVQHGEIVTTVGGGAWIANGGLPPSEYTPLAGTVRAANGAVELELQGPSILGGIGYGLQSIQYCTQSVGGGAVVDRVAVYPGSNSISHLAEDLTNRAAAGCFDLDVGHAGETYTVLVEVSGASLRVGGVEAHWVPTSQLSAAGSPAGDAPDPASDG